MVELSHRERTIKVKIVYYGPPLGGKTTNLQVLHQRAFSGRKGDLVSVNSAQDRTILFDLLPLKAAGFRGFDLKIQLLAVPGQATYAATRRLVLKGADSVVFVANSAADRWEENVQSLREMTQNLLAHQLDPASLPLVIQYNKRDLPQVTPIAMMDRTLNARQVEAIPAVAVRGEGVLETFAAILQRTMRDLSARYRIVETAQGQNLTQWTQQAVLGIFGVAALEPEPGPSPTAPMAPSVSTAEAPTTVAVPPPGVSAPAPPAESAPASSPAVVPPSAPAPADSPPRRGPTPSLEAEPEQTPPWPSERRTFRLTLPEDVPWSTLASPDARANEMLVESYAQASTQITQALDEVREQRDQARQRLEDIQQALAAAQDVLAGQPLDTTLRSVLVRMAEGVSATHATLLIPETDRRIRIAAIRGLNQDPLLKAPAATRSVIAKLLSENEPRIHLAADSLDLGDALESAETPLAAVLAVPIRTPRGLQGLALLYFTPDAARPNPDALAHLGMIARALASSLELARALETLRAAERSLQLALSGTASVRGLDEVVAFLLDLRNRLGSMRQKPDAPLWFLEEFAALAPSLAGALTTARSLQAFSRGEIQREVVPVPDLLAELKAPTLSTTLGPGVGSISGDPVLLRLALSALLDHARGGAAPGTDAPLFHIFAISEGGRVRLSLGSSAPAATSGQRRGEAELNLVRRIAELHGGSFSMENGSQGTRYTLTLLPAA